MQNEGQNPLYTSEFLVSERVLDLENVAGRFTEKDTTNYAGSAPSCYVHLNNRGLRDSQQPVLESTLGATPLLHRYLKQVPLLHALRIASRRIHLHRRARNATRSESRRLTDDCWEG